MHAAALCSDTLSARFVRLAPPSSTEAAVCRPPPGTVAAGTERLCIRTASFKRSRRCTSWRGSERWGWSPAQLLESRPYTEGLFRAGLGYIRPLPGCPLCRIAANCLLPPNMGCQRSAVGFVRGVWPRAAAGARDGKRPSFSTPVPHLCSLLVPPVSPQCPL